MANRSNILFKRLLLAVFTICLFGLGSTLYPQNKSVMQKQNIKQIEQALQKSNAEVDSLKHEIELLKTRVDNDRNFKQNLLQNYLPDFVTMLLGVFLGALLALWTNSYFTKRNEMSKRQEVKTSLIESLKIIKEALKNNIAVLENSLDKLQKHALFDMPLDFAAWETTKTQISNYLQDSILKRDISFHFSRIATIIKLNELYLYYSVGIGAAIGGTEALTIKIKEHLQTQTSKLIEEANKLLTAIDKL